MATTSLTNTNISDTYVGVLHAKGTTIPASGLEYVYDGFGNKSGLQIGQAGNGISVDGPINSTEIGDTFVAAVVDKIYPVGAIYITTNSDNPSLILGGTWEATAQGKFIAGVGTGTDIQNAQREVVVGDNGVTDGRYNHQLKVKELPEHSHTFSAQQAIGGFTQNGNAPDERSAQKSATTDVAGSGEVHNNTPPGYGMYIWKRTA